MLVARSRARCMYDRLSGPSIVVTLVHSAHGLYNELIFVCTNGQLTQEEGPSRPYGRWLFTLITMLRVRYFLIKIIILVTSRCHVKKPRCLSLLKDEAYARGVPFLGKGSVRCTYSSEISLQAGLVSSFPSSLFPPSSSSSPPPPSLSSSSSSSLSSSSSWWILKIRAEAKTSSKGTSNLGVAALTEKSHQR